MTPLLLAAVVAQIWNGLAADQALLYLCPSQPAKKKQYPPTHSPKANKQTNKRTHKPRSFFSLHLPQKA
jgi:hypothetical protein